jgi:predicted RNase H-like HicB family nuclease
MSQVVDRPRVQAEDVYSSLAQVVYCANCDSPLIRVPVLRCADCDAATPLRAFTYQNDRGYIAECIDLNLLTQGRSEEEAISKLQVAMFGYLDTVFDGQSTKGLVLRKSPLPNRIRYHLHRLRCKIGRLFGGHSNSHFIPPQPSNHKEKLCHC